MQLGELGLSKGDHHGLGLIDAHRGPLLDLLDWRDDLGGMPLDNLIDWENLNFETLRARRLRARRGERVLPRIELKAEINRRGNLSVRWYPHGFFDGAWAAGQGHLYRPRTQDGAGRLYQADFLEFWGDDNPKGHDRPSNELLYIQGVAALRLYGGDDQGGPGYECGNFKRLLIFALRACFNSLVAKLRASYEVGLLNDFQFEFADPDPAKLSEARVLTTWRLVSLGGRQAQGDHGL